MEDTKKNGKILGLVLLALLGLGLSIKLSFIYFTVNFVPNSLPSFCAINDVIDCDKVAQTEYAQFMGIPMALYGVFLYTFVLFLCFVDKLQKVKWLSFLNVFKNQTAYIFALYCITFTMSMGLMLTQFCLIHKFCILCFVTYVVDLISLLYAKDYKKPFWYEFKVSVTDFLEGVKIKSNMIALIILAILACGVLYYTKTSYIMTPHMKKYDVFNTFKKMKGNPFNIKGNTLGNPDGKVVIYEYSDFECPICPIMNKMLQKVTTEYNNIYVVHYNYPLDMDCNPIITRPFHKNSCKLAKYAIASKKQDKYWEMINILFDAKPDSGEMVRKLADKNGIDSTQLANDYISQETEEELQREISEGIKREIDATPTLIINGKSFVGYMDYDKLKTVLEEYGATKNNK